MKPSPGELRELGELGRVARPCGIYRGVVHSSYCDFNECNMNATVGEWSLRDGKFRKPPATSPTPPTRPTPPGQPATCAVGGITEIIHAKVSTTENCNLCIGIEDITIRDSMRIVHRRHGTVSQVYTSKNRVSIRIEPCGNI